MDRNLSNVIIAFHSYPNRPCFDGLVSAIMASQFYFVNTFYIPYWRTNESFQKIKNTVMRLGTKNTTIVYMDCAPELLEEVNYLSSILHETNVRVIDHHPLSKNSQMNALSEFSNFSFVFNADKCASIISYDLFKIKERFDIFPSEFLNLVQFTDYEGQSEEIAGTTLAFSIAEKIFQNALVNFPDLKSNLEKIVEAKMQIYYLLLYITPNSEDWEFLYKEESSEGANFKEKANSYLSYCFSILSGKNKTIFTMEMICDFLQLLENLTLALNGAKITGLIKVGENFSRILIVPLDILKFGRNVESYVKEKMIKTGSSYAILINSPTHTKDGALMYYLSLRRVNEKFDARDLAELLKKKSGSSIGGGHPWASGVTLNQEQYDRFTDSFVAEGKVQIN